MNKRVNIGKKSFFNHRCARYNHLERLYKQHLAGETSLPDDYFAEVEEDSKEREMNEPYIKRFEKVAISKLRSIFGDNIHYSEDNENLVRYNANVDLDFTLSTTFNAIQENDDITRVFNIKATTTSDFNKRGFKMNKEPYEIFEECENQVLKLKELSDRDFLNFKGYSNQRKKLQNKSDNIGRMVYEMAFQNYILKSNGKEKVENYLIVLNSDYVFDGTYQNGEPMYKDDLVKIIDLNVIVDEMDEPLKDEILKVKNFYDDDDFTEDNEVEEEKDFSDNVISGGKNEKIKKDINFIEEISMDLEKGIGLHCGHKKDYECKFKSICWRNIPKKGSIFTYDSVHHGFKDESGIKMSVYDLVKKGIKKIQDVSDELIEATGRVNNEIQKNVLVTNEVYKDVGKIQTGLDKITYPAYHLDFETFPCPLPRFKGEKPYDQSLFQYSLHVETKPGVCDKEKDHYEYLATSHNDERRNLLEKLLSEIPENSDGSVIVYNKAFEDTRLKELTQIFPEYEEHINAIRRRLFDLLDVVKTNSKFYMREGYSKERAKKWNYYHPKLEGSFSIKKVLPVFSDLSYENLEIGNGVDAMIAYGSFHKFEKEEFKIKMNSLRQYCKQDTWAMVEVLEGLRKL